MYAVDLAKQLKATVIALSIIDKRSFMGQTVPVPVAMRSYGFSVGNVCERDMTLLEGKTNG